MFRNKSILVICPARGGSKGLPRKNVLPLNNTPLVGLVGRFVKVVPEIDRAIVSTDDDEIARIAEEYGLDAPFRRPEDLSGDRIGDYEVLMHALQAVEEIDRKQYDVILMLQPTSPLRRPEHIQAAIHRLVEDNLDSVWSVSPSDLKFHPLKQLKIEEGELGYYDPAGSKIIARQELESLYFRNGIVYAISRRCLTELGDIKGKRTGALVVEDPFVNIDDQEDLDRAERLIRDGLATLV